MSIQDQIERLSGEIKAQANLMSQIKTTLAGKAAPSGGGSDSSGATESNIFKVTADINATTMQVGNVSHSAFEIINAINSGKIVQLIGQLEMDGMLVNVMFGVRYFVSAGTNYLTVCDAISNLNGNLLYMAVELISDNSGANFVTSSVIKAISTM